MNRPEIPDVNPPPAGDRPPRLLGLRHSPAEVGRLTRGIYDAVLVRSPNIRTGNFAAIAPIDLQLLFDLYDAAFFDGMLGAMLRDDRATLDFRLSRRMTRVGGTTSRRRWPATGPVHRVVYEIAVSTTLLYSTFQGVDRTVNVGGLVCRDRLEALQRIFEHELLHLTEFLGWGQSSCDRENFHSLSQRIFSHAGVRHELVTPREVAAATYDIHVGDRVSFEFEGLRRVGRVNRITRRATVLVEDPDAPLFTDGKRYGTFYVALARLRKESGGQAARG